MSDMDRIIRQVLSDIRVDLSDEFDKNFERQAFFSEAWARRKSPTRPGGSILIDKGTLRSSIRSESTNNSITFQSTVPYASIHNDGGDITVTRKMKMFFRKQFYKSNNRFARKKDSSSSKIKKTLSDAGFYAWTSQMQLTPTALFWRNLALMKEGSKIHIPKRRFLGQSPEVERIVREIIDKDLSEYFNTDFKL